MKYIILLPFIFPFLLQAQTAAGGYQSNTHSQNTGAMLWYDAPAQLSSHYQAKSDYPAGFIFTDACGKDVFEENNSILSAAELPRVGVNQNATLCSNGDEDWFSFTVSASKPNIRITFHHPLPIFDLALYDASGTLLSSELSDTLKQKQLLMNGLTVGKYYIRLYSEANASSSEGYSLRIQEQASPFTLKSSASRPDSSTESPESFASTSEQANIKWRLYPNPAHHTIYIESNIAFDSPQELVVLNMQGKIVHRTSLEAHQIHHQIDISRLSIGMYQVYIKSSHVDTNWKLSVIK